MVKSTKDFTETQRLNSQIAEEQKQIAALYSHLGKMIYDTYGVDAQEPAGEVCRQIAEAFTRIKDCEDEISRIKGIRRCTACGAEIPQGSVFCGNCGASAPLPPQPEPPAEGARCFCTGCGSQLAPGAVFCTSCGKKQ